MAPQYILNATLYAPPRWVAWADHHFATLRALAIGLAAVLFCIDVPLFVPVCYLVLLALLFLIKQIALANHTQTKVVLSDAIVLVKYPQQTLKFVLKEYAIRVMAEPPIAFQGMARASARQPRGGFLGIVTGRQAAKTTSQSVPKISRLVLTQGKQTTTLPLLLWQRDYEGLQHLTHLWQAAGLRLQCYLKDKEGWQPHPHL